MNLITGPHILHCTRGKEAKQGINIHHSFAYQVLLICIVLVIFIHLPFTQMWHVCLTEAVRFHDLSKQGCLSNMWPSPRRQQRVRSTSQPSTKSTYSKGWRHSLRRLGLQSAP